MQGDWHPAAAAPGFQTAPQPEVPQTSGMPRRLLRLAVAEQEDAQQRVDQPQRDARYADAARNRVDFRSQVGGAARSSDGVLAAVEEEASLGMVAESRAAGLLLEHLEVPRVRRGRWESVHEAWTLVRDLAHVLLLALGVERLQLMVHLLYRLRSARVPAIFSQRVRDVVADADCDVTQDGSRQR